MSLGVMFDWLKSGMNLRQHKKIWEGAFIFIVFKLAVKKKLKLNKEIKIKLKLKQIKLKLLYWK